ncbi:MAG TPA: hypothetical protein VHE30_22320 [Polyangiaceae bacterium]|nr:hypothetical protein [Polyangiaceae bacterium]
MPRHFFRNVRSLFTALALTAAVPACTADVHDNTLNVEDPKVSFDTSVDVNDVRAGESIPLSLHAENVFLVDPTKTPPPEHEKDAGHFQIYLDDVNTTPLLVTIQEQVSIQIPENIQKGDHKLICRVHHHDGTPTAATFELDFKVTVSGSVTVSSSQDAGG